MYRYPQTLATGGLLKYRLFFWNNRNLINTYSRFLYSKNLFFRTYFYVIRFLEMPLSLSHSGFNIFRITNHIIWEVREYWASLSVFVLLTYFLFLLFGEFLKKVDYEPDK